MRRLLVSTAAMFVLAPTFPLHAEGQSATTVRGKLTVTCARSDRRGGEYRYILNNKVVRSLSSDCIPGMAETHISIDQVIHSAGSTLLVVLEGSNAYTDDAKILFLPKSGAGSMVEMPVSGSVKVEQKSPTSFRISAVRSGYEIDMKHLSHWSCTVDIDFATAHAVGKPVGPHEKGLPAEACLEKVVKIPLR
jgi:hypothetical protein